MERPSSYRQLERDAASASLAQGRWSAIANTHIIWPIPERVNAEFLWYLLNDENFWVKDQAIQPFVQVGATLEKEIPLPPLAEQERLVGVLRERLEAVARARRAAEEQVAAARALPAAYLRAVFPSRDQPLPPGWRWVGLGEVCEFIRGVSFDKAEVRTSPADGFVPILRAGNIQDSLDLENDLIWTPAKNVSEEQMLRVGDVAICMSSGSPDVVGKTAQLLRPWHGSVGAFCGISRPKHSVVSEWIGHWFRSAQFTEWRDTQARGANIQNLRFSQIEQIEIPLPPLAEQERTVGVLRERLAAVERLRRALEEQLAAIEALPAALLRQAFRGEL